MVVDVKRIARIAMILSFVAIAFAYASAFRKGGAPSWAPWLLAVGIPLSSIAIMVMGAHRKRTGIGRLAVPFCLVALLLGAGFCLALALPANENAGSMLFLGLPLRAAAIVYGVGFLPMLVLPIAYAVTFDTQTLSEEDVRRARALGAAYRKTD